MPQQVKLKVNDGFYGFFQLDNEDTLVAPILNLSTDKALIAIPRKNLKAVQAGDRVEFLQIIGATNINFKDRIPAKIHWIKDVDHVHYLAAAFYFSDLAETTRDQIGYFVNSEKATRGQYL